MDKILSQLNNSPILIASRYLSSLPQFTEEPEQEKFAASYWAKATGIVEDQSDKPYEMHEGIAIIPVKGTLIHNLGWSGWGYTGYDVIRRKLNFAAKDNDVKAIYMPFHSAGGSVFGCADTADLIAKVGKEKDIWALSEDMAYSAAQWLHSQATRRLTTQSAGLGSVGVVIAHFDYSKMLKEEGIKVTMIYDGKHKVDGNPYEKLSKEVKDRLLEDCQKTRLLFAEAVAKGTGMSVDEVLQTEADTYTGAESVEIGLAQDVVSSNEILDEFAEHVASLNSTITMGSFMTTEARQQADVITLSEHNAALDKAVCQAKAEARTEERQRISAIVGSEEAKGRESLANHMAFETDSTVEASLKIIGASAKLEPVQQAQESNVSDAFLTAMANEEHPNLSADDVETASKITADQEQANQMLADFKMATGAK